MEQKRIDEIYGQLGTFVVELTPDAWSLGPRFIHDLIAKTRGYLNSVSFILQEVLQEKQTLDRAKHAADAVFKIESDRLLAEDPRCQPVRLPNIDDRRAMVNLILREQVAEIQSLEGQLLDLSYVERATKHRFQELKATMTDIRAQRSLIRDAIDSGSFYGDETSTSRGTRHASPSALDEDEINKSMAELDDMLLNGEAPETETTEESTEATSDPTEATSDPTEETTDTLEVSTDTSLEGEIEVEEEQPLKSVGTSEVAVDDFSDVLEEFLPDEALKAENKANGQSEDPDISRFLEGDDDLSNLFDDDELTV